MPKAIPSLRYVATSLRYAAPRFAFTCLVYWCQLAREAIGDLRSPEQAALAKQERKKLNYWTNKTSSAILRHYIERKIMNIETTPSLLDIKFELPKDWFIVLDVNRSENKSNAFAGVLIVDHVTDQKVIPSPRFDIEMTSINLYRPLTAPAGASSVHWRVIFPNVSAGVAKLIKSCMKAFMVRYNEVKVQMSTRACNEGNEWLSQKCFVDGKYCIYQMGADGGSGGLVIIIRETELRSGRVVSGISLVDCGKPFPMMIITMPPSYGAIYNVEFSCLIGGYCIGTLNCLNHTAMSVCKEKIKEYFS